MVFHDPFRSRYTHKNDERMTCHCLGALDTIRLISVDLRISVYHVLHVLFGLPLTCLRLNDSDLVSETRLDSNRLDSTSVLGKSRQSPLFRFLLVIWQWEMYYFLFTTKLNNKITDISNK